MKTIFAAIFMGGVMGGVLAAPTVTFAQEAGAMGRAAVLTQMRQLADAGYCGNGDETTYPTDVQSAQRRIDQGTSAPVDTSGYGAAPGTHSESGAREPTGPRSLYFGS